MVQKTYLTNKRTGTRYRVNGIIQSARLPEKRELCGKFHNDMIYKPHQLPPKVDLRSDMTPVENQEQMATCTANALAGAYEYLTKKFNGKNTDVSRLFIYYNARVKDQGFGKIEDTGCSMTGAVESLSEHGTCLESIWPYKKFRVNRRPHKFSYSRARKYKITSALRVGINLHEMKSCLAQGFPFAFGLRLYESFDRAASKGVVPMPTGQDQARASHGNHAMLAVGYSNQSRAFIVRNSWGKLWGDRGHCYIPYDYLTNPKYSYDVWTIRKVNTKHLGKKHWDKSDAINYTYVPQFTGAHNDTDDRDRVFETVEESDEDDGEDDVDGHYRKDLLAHPWHQHRTGSHAHRINDHHRHHRLFGGHFGIRRSVQPPRHFPMMPNNPNLPHNLLDQSFAPRRHFHRDNRMARSHHDHVNPFYY